VRRRDFLRIAALTPFAALSPDLLADVPAAKASRGAEPSPDGVPHRFSFGDRQFLLDGRPFQIRSGEMHPIRIPDEYWQHRIRMAKAMGLNTIAVYIMWNALESEPGVFDLKTGRRDFARFIHLCQQESMWVYLRPGPYVCAEWDFGGLPPYLLRDDNVRVRNRDDASYMRAVERYMDAVAPHIVPLMVARGGPILMMQIENEYASFGSDLDYLKQIEALWRQRGLDGPFAISDGLGQIRKERTYLPGAALGMDGDTDFSGAQKIAGNAPVWIGEGYPGWLTHWGDKDFQSADYLPILKTLLDDKRSFNLYVVHGGTNFGFGAGANANDDDSNFEPVITSYDYGAPINERGEATPAYHAFRKLLGAHVQHVLPDVPSPPIAISFPVVTPLAHASLWDNLPAAVAVRKPRSNEQLFAQDHGLVLYRKEIPRAGTVLTIDGVRDYAIVFGDGQYVNYISRMQNAQLRGGNRIDLPTRAGSEATQLDILVDSFGHVGYGHAMTDRKGIVGGIRLDGDELQAWNVYSLPFDDDYIRQLKPRVTAPSRPGIFFRATIWLDQLGDSYIDMAGWSKGYLWINGRLLGRYWNIGPQQRLYCPASWLHQGNNELLVFDLHRTVAAPIRGVATWHA
jgi:hypothetical protein